MFQHEIRHLTFCGGRHHDGQGAQGPAGETGEGGAGGVGVAGDAGPAGPQVAPPPISLLITLEPSVE